MSMISVKILLAFVFISSISHHSDAETFWNEYCIADVQAPEQMLREAIDWACANGANCSLIKPGKACYLPNTMLNHANHAFNSYYQTMKHQGGSCYFKAAAVVSAVDPCLGSCKLHLSA